MAAAWACLAGSAAADCIAAILSCCSAACCWAASISCFTSSSVLIASRFGRLLAVAICVTSRGTFMNCGTASGPSSWLSIPTNWLIRSRSLPRPTAARPTDTTGLTSFLSSWGRSPSRVWIASIRFT